MDERNLSAMCGYIEDFISWYSDFESPPDIKVFVEDRFSEASDEKKELLFGVFNEFQQEIVDEVKLNTATYNAANKLLVIL